MTDLITYSLAVDLGKDVRIIARDNVGDDVSFTITKDEYRVVKKALTVGVDVSKLRNVITPSDIIGFLYETNPEAMNVMVDVEVQRGLRQKLNGYTPAIVGAGIFATIILAMAIAYLMVTNGAGGGVVEAAQNTAGAISF